MGYKECVSEIVAQADEGAITQKQADKLLTAIDSVRRLKRGQESLLTVDEEVRNALEQHLHGEVLQARIKKLNALRNKSIKDASLARAVNFHNQFKGKAWYSPQHALEMLVSGSERDFFGGKQSFAARTTELTSQFLGAFEAMLQDNGLSTYWSTLDDELPLARAIFNVDELEPDTSLPTEARAIAEYYKKTNKAQIARLNRNGAFIKELQGYIVAQSHDPDKIRAAGRDAWKQNIRALLDEDKTFHASNDFLDNARSSFIESLVKHELQKYEDSGEKIPRGLKKQTREEVEARYSEGAYEVEFQDHISTEIDRRLDAMYDALATGKHTTSDDVADYLAGFVGGGNLARQVSSNRKLHFMDASAFYAYHQKFGVGTLREAVVRGLERNAKNIAALETFGTNPANTLKILKEQFADELIKQGQHKAAADLMNFTGHEDVYKTITGEANRPERLWLAQFTASSQAIMGMAKLGGAIYSAVGGDVPTIGRALERQGVPILSAHVKAYQAAFAGATSEETKRLSRSIYVGLNHLEKAAMMRLGGGAIDNLPGALSKTTRLFYKLNALTWWTDSAKQGTAAALADWLGQHANLKAKALPEELQIQFRKYGITPQEWDAIRSVAIDTADNGRAVVPESLDNLDDAAIKKALDLDAKGQEALKQLVDFDVKQQLAQTLNESPVYNAAQKLRDYAASLREEGQLQWGKNYYTSFGRYLEKMQRNLPEDITQAMQAVGYKKGMNLKELMNSMSDTTERTLREESTARQQIRVDKWLAQETQRSRDALTSKLRNYFVDIIDQAVLTPGAYERNIATGGTRPGTFGGSALRLLSQFSAFPLTYITKVWGPAIFEKASFDTAGMVALMAHGLVLTTVATAAKDVAEGKTPMSLDHPASWGRIVSRSGFFGIYGDYLMAESLKAGPVLSLVGDLMDIKSKAMAGEWESAEKKAIRTLYTNIPFNNLFYTKQATDYLIYSMLTEQIDPGYNERQRERIMEKYGQQYWMPGQ